MTGKGTIFAEISLGEYFKCYGELFLKTEVTRQHGVLCNAVNVRTGIVASFGEASKVTKAKAKIVEEV